MKEMLFIIDASAWIYRSYYAAINDPKIDSKGRNISALYGFAYKMITLLKYEKPDYIVVAKDLSSPTFRHDMYVDYKANRKKQPVELTNQFKFIDKFLQSSGIETVSHEGFEADDVMASLALMAENSGIKSNIVTRDKDMMQVVNDNINIYDDSVKDCLAKIIDSNEVREKFGVEPNQIVDLLALMGDSSDNIPGVNKVGKKTAAKLLNDYGTLEYLYDKLYEIKSKTLMENLRLDKEKAYLSKRLATLRTDVPIGIKIKSLKTNLNKIGMTEFIEEWELNNLLESFEEEIC